MIESIEKLRDWSHRYDNSWIQRDGSIMFCTSNSQFAGDGENYGESIRSMIDEIEAEIAERYIELPVDADGETIHVGDTVYSDFHDEWRDGVTVYEIAFTDGDGTRVYTADGKWVKVNRCSHVKPRTIEDVLENFAHNYNSISGKPDEDELWVKLLADTSAELREMMGGDDG